MDEQKLNRKLAEWAGFKFVDSSKKDVTLYELAGILNKGRPDFTQSLDACFEWLVPKLDYPLLLSSSIGTDKITRYACLIEVYDVHPTEYSVVSIETPALALCLAIERLIDKEQP